MNLEQMKSAIYNDIVGGLNGITSTPTISLEQLEDDIIDERLVIIKEFAAKNILPRKDLMMSINCIPVDCKSMAKCPCGEELTDKITHFEIPQLLNDVTGDAIEYLGAVDRSRKFKVYTSKIYKQHKYKRRGANDPYVYIETTPNENNMYDGWIFNAPFLKMISVIGIFKDPRQLTQYNCCDPENELVNYNFIDNEIKKRVTEKKIRYYRQLAAIPTPNTQTPK